MKNIDTNIEQQYNISIFMLYDLFIKNKLLVTSIFSLSFLLWFWIILNTDIHIKS